MMTLKWINTIAFAAMVTVNALANLLPIGGNTTGQVSEMYPNLLTPAPITFVIWGLIYLLMLVFVVYQWEVFDGGTHSAKVRENVGIWFAVSCALNIIWIFLWHFNRIALSAVCITLLLVSLIVIQGRLGGAGGSFPLRMAAGSGFSVYYGWIIVATIVNISALLTKIGWGGWGLPNEFWAAAVMMIGSLIGAAVVLLGGNETAGLAVMWAYAGILIRQISPAYYGGAYPFVIAAALVSEMILLMAILLPVIDPILQKMQRIGKNKKERRLS